tara:strand:- start:41 stop:682 length:642 start_codon:yes stop_codon:yes gene_type:complete
MTITEKIQLYLDEKISIVKSFPISEVVKVTHMLFDTYDKSGTVYVMANGGNAATMDHLYCDFKHHPFVTEDKTKQLPKGIKRLKIVNLCSSPAELTGLVNDLGIENMYSGALSPFVTSDDLVMAYTGSGNSGNVIRAIEVAKEAGAKTFSMTKGDGGKCKKLSDVCLIVPGTSKFPGQTGKNDNNFHFEDAVLYVNSILVGLLKERIETLMLK